MAPGGRVLGLVEARSEHPGVDSQMNVVLNWLEELKQRVPEK